jgi:hypothetical protein
VMMTVMGGPGRYNRANIMIGKAMAVTTAMA